MRTNCLALAGGPWTVTLSPSVSRTLPKVHLGTQTSQSVIDAFTDVQHNRVCSSGDSETT